MNKTLVLGGVKSGKSLLAEQLASQTQAEVIYIATATAGDEAMQQRIQAHKNQRPSQWLTVEAPIQLAKAIEQHSQYDNCILVDCLTLWLTNLLMADDEALLKQEIEAFVTILSTMSGKIIIVSNETNMGIMPLGELSRQYCDQIGILHQRIASLADRVILTVAGLPHVLKGQL
ncbi:bifunctional adenosylcobinamide kinase/adenosylcobinamide-phosphate guanylyltransferase [Methylophaga sp. 41_12_T18]|nr:bifunctional adenosylcobinamide kinase/adenosylcobinamide-phosphate guanylyltransferase [Methylophaga sp. 41_12_T18]